ncbi:MAG: hypothetical protein QOK43_2893 [Acidimicrobiaceae bacterium]|nr:hypothetical protein [Acidimicrobiaceae bacterium]
MRNLRQAGAAPHRARGLGALLAALLCIAASAPAASADVDAYAQDANTVVGNVDAFDGPQFAAPADGRVRGYGFSFTVTKSGPVDRYSLGSSWHHAGQGQRLVGFNLRIDDPADSDHPVHGAVVVAGGGRIAIGDGAFDLQRGEWAYVASVPAGTQDVGLELSAAGYAQTFSLTSGARTGPQPAVLYRDLLSPDVAKEGAGERTMRVADEATGDRGSLTFSLKQARLSFFTPPEPVGPAEDPAQAFLVVEADVESPYSSDVQFTAYKALPASAVTATLPDGTVVQAQHAGPEDDGFMSGSYYFPVPGDAEAARVTIKPGTFDAYRYGEAGAEPTPVKAEGTAVFDIEFTPGGASKLPKLPKGSTATTARPASPETGSGDVPTSRPKRTGGGSTVPVLLLLLALAAVGAFAARNWLRRRITAVINVGPSNTAPDDVGDLSLPTPFATLVGQGAVAAVRAAVIQELDAGHSEVVVLASGPVEGLGRELEATDARVVHDAAHLTTEVEAAALSAARAAAEAAEDGSNGQAWSVMIVAPGDAAEQAAAAAAASTGTVLVRALALDGDRAPVVQVDASGVATLPDGRRGDVPLAEAVPAPEGAPIIEAEPPAPATPAHALEGDTPAIDVALLGAYRVSVAGKEGTGGWRTTARELLALLAVHPDGLTLEAAVEAMWPSADPDKARVNFRQAVKNLRKMLRPPSGVRPDWTPVELVSGRYRLDTEVISIDVRQFEAAAAAAASGDLAAAQRAVDLYRDELAADEDFLWAEPHRERLRGVMVRVIGRLTANCRASGDLDRAALLLERAISIRPDSEPLYRDLMEVERAQGNEDGVRHTYARLEAALAREKLKPTARTKALLAADTSPAG